jgi:iron complex outermembrane receptor protein
MKYFIIIISFLFTLTISAQDAFIKGKVLDSKSGESLMGATFFLDGKAVVSSDMDGAYEIKTTAGSHQLVVSYVGYDNVKQTFNLVSGESKEWMVRLNSSARELNLMVVTGSRYEKKITEETVSIDVVSAELIKNVNPIDAAEVISKTPGVSIVDGQASIRGGSGYSYGAGSRVSVLIDGMPILAADQMNADWHYVPIEITDQIEVIKGAASVLYGSGSMNGIMNVITSWPTDKPTTTISPYTMMYGDFNKESQRWYGEWEQPFSTGMFFRHSRKIKENFDLVIGGNYHIERSYLQDNDEQRFRANFKTRYRDPKIKGLTYGVNGSFMFEHSGRFFLWQNSDENAYRIYAGSNDKYYYFNVDPYLRYFDSKGNRHVVNGRIYRKFRYGGTDINTVANIAYLDYQFQRKFLKDMFTITAGAMGTYGWVQSSIFLDSLQMDSLGNAKKFFQLYSGAAFAQLEFSWKRLNLLAGVRYEINGADLLVEGSVPVARFGVNFRASESTFLRGSFGQSYRIPSLAERFVEGKVGTVNIFPNIDLLPEKGWAAEVGLKQTFNIARNWSGYFDFAAFWMEYDNMIQYSIGIYPPPGQPNSSDYLGFKPFNVERARIAGLEFSLTGNGKIGEVELIPFMGYTYTYPGDLKESPEQQDVGVFLNNMFSTFGKNLLKTPESDLLLPFRNRHMVRFDLQANWKNYGLGMNIQYNTFMEKIDKNFMYIELAIPGFYTTYVNNRMDRDGDFILDLRGSYRIPKFNSTISFIVKNATNLEYAARPGIMNAPRSFTLRWDFTF